MLVFSFFTSAVWLSHASPLLGVHPRLRVWPLCFSLSEVIYSFYSLSIRSRFWTKSWSIFFSSSPFGLYDRSFDPSVVNEELASFFRTLGTFSFSIVAFLGMAFLGASFSCLVILAFALDGYSTSAGPSDFSNFSLHSYIKFWTLFLKIVQSSIEWPETLEW